MEWPRFPLVRGTEQFNVKHAGALKLHSFYRPSLRDRPRSSGQPIRTMPATPLDSATLTHRGRAAVIVAHPDDEILWCGGYILAHPEFTWRIVTLCRGDDPDRAPKFRRVLQELGAEGEMGNLDDGPDQTPLPPDEVQKTASRLLAGNTYNLILTHGPNGEYTRHRRHEECCRSVVALWRSGGVDTENLWLFAYEDGGGAYLPRVREDADRRNLLGRETWLEKLRLIRDVYGFAPDSWEAQTTPREEGFWCFDSARTATERTGIRGKQP